MGLRKASNWLGLVEHDDDFDDEYATEETATEPDDDGAQAGDAADRGLQIAMVRPRNFRDAATVGEYFRQDIPVIINLDDMNDGDARRIVDFASGLILGRQGDIERLSRRVFLILPAGATILTDQGKMTDEGFYNQA
ncbi:cell division protein SepF [Actinomadura fibrosa]|uniref:Cell division protein SepF n=1 Tax=Actinomadura fibrosa TaxID=111802 RepID=A0ABW2XLQ1_9ACTN|nr:cell division protein SepF [Actinomadura fibrosa]